MPSSISDSERPRAAHAIVLLLGLLLAYATALEIGARFAFPRVNHYWRRILADKRTALSLRPRSNTDPATMLIVGNSLLEWAIDRDALTTELSPRYSPAFLPIENTTYLDWYFGLRRLFAEGSHPNFVGLCLSTRQLISDQTTGESFAYNMMRERDILDVKQQARLDLTSTSNYFFAGLSSWLGYRSEIHNWLLQKTIPNVNQVTKYFPGNTPPMPPTDIVVARALLRLRLLEKFCDEHGSRFFLVIPPTFDVYDSSVVLQAAAARENILVLVPYAPSEIPSSAFQQDGFHLNAKGAALFTKRAGPLLIQGLSRN